MNRSYTQTNKKKKVQKGFSMIELIVVTCIVAIMTAVLFSTKKNDNANTEVEATAYQVAAAIRNLQNEALSGKEVTAGRFARTFIFSTDSGSYYVNYRDAGNANLIASPITNNIKSTVQFETTPTITFTSPLATVTPFATTAIRISSRQNTAIFSNVCVYASGAVEVYKGTSCP